MTSRQKLAEILGALLVVGSLAGVTFGALYYEFRWRPGTLPKDAKVFNITFIGTDRWTLRRVGNWNYWRTGLGDLREIQVHEGDRVLFRLTSLDVTHGFAIPAYGIENVEVDPGQIQTVELVAKKAGRFLMFCDRYCGHTHPDMRARFIVEPASPVAASPGVAYAAAPGALAAPGTASGENGPAAALRAAADPAERGRAVFTNFGCYQCHGRGGAGGVENPNAQGGLVPALTRVAEGYTDAELMKKIREGVPVVAKQDPHGFAPPRYMPPWKDYLTDGQLGDLVAYLKSLEPKGAAAEGW